METTFDPTEYEKDYSLIIEGLYMSSVFPA